MSKTIYGWIWLSIFVVCVAGLTVGGVISYKVEPPGISPDRRVVTLRVRRDSFVIITGAYLANDNCSGWIYRSIIDANGDIIYGQSEYRPTSILPAHAGIKRIFIPNYAAFGHAQYFVTIEWNCNLVQRMFPTVVNLPVLDFEIVDHL